MTAASGFSQTCLSAFSLTNVTLHSGTAKKVGAVYKFPKAAPGVDVHIKIDALVKANLIEMDLSDTGYDKAWQPQVETDSAGGYIEWTISFKKAGTNVDTNLCVPVSAIDIDGGDDVQEFIETRGYDYYNLGSPTNLTISNPGSGWTLKALGPKITYSGIDVTATNVQIQVNFLNVRSIRWRTGSNNKESRLYSLYFNTFLSCSNVTNGGTIGGNEFFCGTSFNPAVITNVTTPTGGSGTMEYRWLSNNASANPTDINWQVIDNETNSTYDPKTISITTHYKRQARRSGCADLWESTNVISKTLNPIPTALIATTESSCTANDNRVMSGATVNMTASGGSSYAWSNALGSGATKAVNPTVNTTYTVTVTDANGCTATRSSIITIVNIPTATISASENSCKSNDDKTVSGATVSLSANGGSTYTWSNSLGTGSNKTVTPSVTTTYVVTVTDINGCIANASKTISILTPTTLSTVVTNVSCNGGNTGAINLTASAGTAPYAFNWGGGVTTEDRTNLTAGSYTVTSTDVNGCTQTSLSTITQPTAINIATTKTDIKCNGASTGTINLTVTNGTSPYTYNWGGGITTQNRTGLTAATYTVTVTDAKGCTRSSSITLTQPNTITITNTQNNVKCFGSSTGTINISVSGGVSPFTYNWGGGITTQNRTGLIAGTYTVTVTDANSCTKTSSITITQPAAALALSTTVTSTTCGNPNGAINLTATGGTTPYTFKWQDGPTTEDRTALAAGTYMVTVTDGGACTATISATINTTAGSTLTIATTDPACSGTSTGAIDLTATGNGPFTYDWGGGITSEDRTGLPAGAYMVTVTNNTGCKALRTITLTSPAVITLSANPTQASCMGSSTGAIDLTATGGTAPYTYNWGGGVTTEDRTGLAAGNYVVTVTDAKGCTKTLSQTITQPTAVNLSISLTQVTCIGGTDGAIDLSVVGGNAPYTFNWGGGITTEDRTALAEGTYTVLVTDANGCTTTTSATLTALKGAPNPPTGLKH